MLFAFYAENKIRIDVKHVAQGCKRVERRRIIPFHVVRNGLLFNSKHICKFCLRITAMLYFLC